MNDQRHIDASPLRLRGEETVIITRKEEWRTERGGDVHDQWRDILSVTHLPWRVAPEGPLGGRSDFEASVQRRWIDDLALVDCECDPCSGTRTRRELAETDGEFVVVLFTLGGCESVTQGDSDIDLKPGDVVAWDSRRPVRFTVRESLTKRSLFIPRSALDELSGRISLSSGVKLDGTMPATRLLSGYLGALSRELPGLTNVAVKAARNATLELFLGALRAESDLPQFMTHPALRDAISRYIERHLLDARMSPASIAAAHGVSVRTVNRIFNSTGDTIGEVIRIRRLARARGELTETNHTISTIAHRWGFSDTSHFSRTFKAQYGAPPSEYRIGSTFEIDGAPTTPTRAKAGRLSL